MTTALKDVQDLHYTTRLSAAVPSAEDCINSAGDVIPKVNVSDLYAAQDIKLHPSLHGQSQCLTRPALVNFDNLYTSMFIHCGHVGVFRLLGDRSPWLEFSSVLRQGALLTCFQNLNVRGEV